MKTDRLVTTIEKKHTIEREGRGRQKEGVEVSSRGTKCEMPRELQGIWEYQYVQQELKHLSLAGRNFG